MLCNGKHLVLFYHLSPSQSFLDLWGINTELFHTLCTSSNSLSLHLSPSPTSAYSVKNEVLPLSSNAVVSFHPAEITDLLQCPTQIVRWSFYVSWVHLIFFPHCLLKQIKILPNCLHSNFKIFILGVSRTQSSVPDI